MQTKPAIAEEEALKKGMEEKSKEFGKRARRFTLKLNKAQFALMPNKRGAS
jgi:hypothetical protein